MIIFWVLLVAVMFGSFCYWSGFKSGVRYDENHDTSWQEFLANN
jgi:hypothetical protein